MKTKKNKKSGFTLVELMIVAAIIAILAAIIIPLMAKNKESAVAAEGQSLCSTVMTAAKAQWARTSVWPATVAALDDATVRNEITGTANWSVTTLTGPDNATATVSGGQGDITGTITLQNGAWSGTGKFADL